MSFVLGVIAGVIGMWFLYTGNRRRIKIIQEEKQRLQQEKQIVVEFMHNMVEAVGEGVSRITLFQRIIHAAILCTGGMSACIFEKRSDDTLKGIAVEGLFPPQRPLPEDLKSKLMTRARFVEEVLKSEIFSPGEGIIGEVGKTQRAILITDTESDPRIVKHEDDALKIRSMIVAPILFQDNLIGVLAVANSVDGLAFNDTDFSLVESLAEQAGLAVHNSDMMQLQIEKNRIDLDIELASNIQGLLLPKDFPFSDDIQISTIYEPAQKIGGDLYDIFKLSENKIGVAIADVSGKGIPASLLMAICQTNLRHISHQTDSPAEVLRQINAQMEQSMQRDMFITIIYAIIDLEQDLITFARAGHELPFHLVKNSDGNLEVNNIQSEGMALGMVAPEIFNRVIHDKTIPFNSGEVFLLYTDGVTECINANGDEYSGKRLADAFKGVSQLSSQDMLNGIMESVSRFTGSVGQSDDLTLITIKHG